MTMRNEYNVKVMMPAGNVTEWCARGTVPTWGTRHGTTAKDWGPIGKKGNKCNQIHEQTVFSPSPVVSPTKKDI